MKDHVAAGNRLFQRVSVAEIAYYSIRLQSQDIFRVAGRADQEAEIGSLLGQNSGYVAAHETGCACDESFHEKRN
jgi:hypothetical protein